MSDVARELPEDVLERHIAKLEADIKDANAVLVERLSEPRGSLAECITRIADQREEARDQRDAMTRQAMKFEADNARLLAAIHWALGVGDSDFRPPNDGEGRYYWRTELRARAFGPAALSGHSETP